MTGYRQGSPRLWPFPAVVGGSRRGGTRAGNRRAGRRHRRCRCLPWIGPDRSPLQVRLRGVLIDGCGQRDPAEQLTRDGRFPAVEFADRRPLWVERPGRVSPCSPSSRCSCFPVFLLLAVLASRCSCFPVFLLDGRRRRLVQLVRRGQHRLAVIRRFPPDSESRSRWVRLPCRREDALAAPCPVAAPAWPGGALPQVLATLSPDISCGEGPVPSRAAVPARPRVPAGVVPLGGGNSPHPGRSNRSAGEEVPVT